MSVPETTPAGVEDVEVALFIQALMLRHGYDFSQYAQASFKRRLQGVLRTTKTPTVGQLIDRVLREPGFVTQVVSALSVPVSEMFRNPEVFLALKSSVFPVLRSYPHVNIWQAGCARGQEVYSLAILLEEADLYERCRIYATDFSAAALEQAREGIFPARDARSYSANYTQAGGMRSMSDYYHARYDFIKLDERLKRNITFANHNLVADGAFCEAHLILCRNVLIYFTDRLQNRVLQLFVNSLVRAGFLCIGNRESLTLSPAAGQFTSFDEENRIFRLVPGAH